MKILVTGGTGTVGKEVVKALRRRGESVRVLTRNKEAKLPDGAEVAVGDLLDPDSLGSLRTSGLCPRDTRTVASLRATPMSLR
jgi:uncharacterized protein YbjT (DUF2867 family)